MKDAGNERDVKVAVRAGLLLDAVAAWPVGSSAVLLEVNPQGVWKCLATSRDSCGERMGSELVKGSERSRESPELAVLGVDLSSGASTEADPMLRQLLEAAGREWLISTPLSAAHWLLRSGVGLAPDWSEIRRADSSVVDWLTELLASTDSPRRNVAVLSTNLEALRLENARLVGAGQAREGFLVRLIHDMRTPLTSMLALTELNPDPVGLSKTTAGVSRSGCMTEIANSCRYQLSLINDLMDLSKSAAGPLRITCEPCNAASVAEECLVLVRPLAEQRNLRLEFESAVGDAWVSADPLRMRQMLMNLLCNAVKFTPAHGVVTLSLARPRVGFIAFRVQDTGIGMGPDGLTNAFQPFFQINEALPGASSVPGSGLGLAIVKELANAQNGRVMATSEPGFGSTFVVELPEAPSPAGAPRNEAVAMPDEASVGAPPAPGHPGQEAMRVVVVDDNDLNREMVTDYLISHGFEVHAFMDGERALEELAKLRPDVVIIDVQMPGLDGLEATRRIRQLGDHEIASVPILGLTAMSLPEDRDRCLAAGMNAYQGKPFSLKVLPSLLRGLVSKTEGGC
jgi:hypothetical protein